MAIAAVDWQIFAAFMLWVVFIEAALDEVSAFFSVLAGLMGIVFAAVLDTVALSSAEPFVRFGILGILFAVSIIFMARGALNLPREVAP